VLAYSLDEAPEFLRWQKRLLPLLSVIAGMVDVISFLTLKIFAAHVTGNLVLIAAVIAEGRRPTLDQDFAVPVFIVATAAVWFLAKTSDRQDTGRARLLLILQFALLTCVLIISTIYHPSRNPGRAISVVDAAVALSAMACQFAFLRIVIPGAPTTAVMTGNLSMTVLALLDILAKESSTAEARRQLQKTLPVLLGFFAGCMAGAAVALQWGDWGWLLPAIAAALAVALVRES
jgi:uncharacterized membrane protein YoaK (UPF0700 family)